MRKYDDLHHRFFFYFSLQRMEFYEKWDEFSKKMVRDLCSEIFVDVKHERSGSLPSAGMVEHMIDLCWLKLIRTGFIRKSDLGGFLRHKVGKTYRRGWLKLVLKRMHLLGLIQNVSSDIIRRRPMFFKK